jgi:hypothetical protein
LALTRSKGHKAGVEEDGVWFVPKKELVSNLQVLLQSRRIKIAPSLPEAQTLMEELLKFRTKVTAATQDPLDSWREGPRDPGDTVKG